MQLFRINNLQKYKKTCNFETKKCLIAKVWQVNRDCRMVPSVSPSFFLFPLHTRSVTAPYLLQSAENNPQ